MSPRDLALRLAREGKSLQQISDVLIREAYAALVEAENYIRQHEAREAEENSDR